MPPNSPRSTQSRDTDREVAGIIGRLLLHYFAPGDLSDSARQAMAQDWLEDLAEFGPAIVAEACREWRRKANGRRPLPGDIRAICVEHQRMRQERQAIAGPSNMDAYARSVGFKNNAERMEQVRKDEAKRNNPANAERLRLLEQERTVQRGGKLRPVREYTADELRRARIALGLEAEPPQVAAE